MVDMDPGMRYEPVGGCARFGRRNELLFRVSLYIGAGECDDWQTMDQPAFTQELRNQPRRAKLSE
jgi:hypothetical protein